MRKSKLLSLLLALSLLAIFALIHHLAGPASGTIAYHLQKLGQLRAREAWRWGPTEQLTDSEGQPVPANEWAYVNPRTWIWYLKGRPTITSQVEEQEKHQQALIRLGYFERREFTFNNRTLNGQLWNEFRTAVSNASLAEPRYMLHLDDTRPTAIRITTCKADVSVFDRIVTQLDTEK